MMPPVPANPVYVRTFLVAARTRSFARTARELSMTQAGVSQHVRRIEEEYGGPVFSRERERNQLTDLGRKVFAFWDGVFRQHGELIGALRLSSPFEGDCRIASSGSFGLMFHAFLLKLNRRHRGLCIRYSDIPHERIVAGLLGDEFDIGFVTQAVSDPRLEAKVIGQEELLLLHSKRLKMRSVKQLLELGYVDHPDGRYGLRRMVAALAPELSELAEEVKSTSYVNFIGNILDPVAEGLGFTVLPDHAYSAYKHRERLTYLRTRARVIDPVYVVRKRGRVLPERYEYILSEFRKLG